MKHNNIRLDDFRITSLLFCSFLRINNLRPVALLTFHEAILILRVFRLIRTEVVSSSSIDSGVVPLVLNSQLLQPTSKKLVVVKMLIFYRHSTY